VKKAAKRTRKAAAATPAPEPAVAEPLPVKKAAKRARKAPAAAAG
jgi:hypothetical protein